MPMYPYSCEACGHADDEFKQMKDADAIGTKAVCPKCGRPQYVRLIAVVNTDAQLFDKPIEMLSIALNDDAEIAEFRRRTGGNVDVSDDPNHPDYGVPIARNRSQKKTALRAMGFVEQN